MYRKTIIAISLATIMSGCAGISSPDRLCLPSDRINITESDHPTKDQQALKIIVLPVDVTINDPAKKQLQTVFRHELEASIENVGSSLVDRSMADKLGKEIKFAEQNGRYNTSGVPIADLAVITEITSSKLSSSFQEARKKEKDGETKYYPAECDFSVEVKAVSKVVALPSMAVLERIEFEGVDVSSTETRDSDCPISNAQYAGLVSGASESAVKYSFALQKLLAPVAGVMELRKCDEGTMVKISMGTEKRIQPSAEINFFQVYKSPEGDIETHSVGPGKVVDIENDGIKQKFSWVAINDEIALKLRKGDGAKLVPEECSMLNLSCWANQLSKKI